MQYGLIGEKLSHSFSKEIHESIASYTYELCEIDRNDLPSFMQKRDFRAINVTIPYKNAVIPFLDEISDEARTLGAVNAIVNIENKLFGYNTDYLGMKDMILRSGISLKDKKVLILGTGATSRTSALVAKKLDAGEILFVSRTKKDGAISYDDAYVSHTDAQIIINATPLGMYPSSYASPLSLEGFSKLEAVFDAVYNPLRTSIVLDARARGLYAESGLYMLVSQAVYAIGLFTGKELHCDTTKEIYNKILNSKENIVLVGMPSCGKTTVGTLLASTLSRELVDLDTEIEKRIGCTISEFFKTHTEKDFRNIESEITHEISKRNGIIVATGGGCILREENRRALRSNGRLYFLDRSLKNLIPTDTRPLASKQKDVEALYHSRYALYSEECDVKINGDLTPNEETDLIIKEFYQKR